MTKYDISIDHDALLIHLYGQIVAAGELDATIFPAYRPMSQFLTLHHPPNGALFEADEEGIWFFMGVEMTSFGAFASVWIAPRKRQSIEAVRTTVQAHAMLFTVAPIVFSVTKQEALLRAHRYFGYAESVKLPKVWAGEDGWVMWITQALFERSRAYGRWQQEHPSDGHAGEHHAVVV